MLNIFTYLLILLIAFFLILLIFTFVHFQVGRGLNLYAKAGANLWTWKAERLSWSKQMQVNVMQT